MNCLLTFLDFLSYGFVFLNLSFVENYQISIFTMLVKQSMINRLSNPINRNRSAAKISKVMSSSKRCNQCKPCKQRQQFKAFEESLILVFLLIIIKSEHEYITSPSSGCEQHKLTLISTFCASFCLKCTSSCGNRHGARARQQYTL